jgi:hypothetical protein
MDQFGESHGGGVQVRAEEVGLGGPPDSQSPSFDQRRTARESRTITTIGLLHRRLSPLRWRHQADTKSTHRATEVAVGAERSALVRFIVRGVVCAEGMRKNPLVPAVFRVLHR